MAEKRWGGESIESAVCTTGRRGRDRPAAERGVQSLADASICPPRPSAAFIFPSVP